MHNFALHFSLRRGKIRTVRANYAASKSRAGLRGWLILALSLLISTALHGQQISNIVTDNIPTNLRIAGPGYFIVQDTLTGTCFATRFGEFSVDVNGYVVTQDGFRLQGLTRNPANTSAFITGSLDLETLGMTANGYVNSYVFQNDGKIILTYSDGVPICAGQVLLQNFPVASLKPFLNGNYLVPTNALPLPNGIPPGTCGVGTVQPGQMEIPVPRLSLTRAQPPAPGFTQGVLTGTGIPTDLAIEGAGYFVVRDTNSGALFATRAGACYVDGSGYLVNYAGLRLQGYNTSDLTRIGDLQIPSDGSGFGDPAFQIYFIVNMNGAITVGLADGTTFSAGQVLLMNCAHPEVLTETNFALFPVSTNAGPWTDFTPPATVGLGWVIPGTVEASQFDADIFAVRQRLNFFEQGSILATTNPTDLAINGEGFFTVRDPVNNVYYATRHGTFLLSGSWLVDTNGYRVQGFTDPGLTTLGDIQIDAQYAPSGTASNATLQQFTIEENGDVIALLSDGTQFTRASVTIQNYKNLQALVPLPGLLYSNVAAAQPLYDTSALANPVISGIIAGNLEQPYILMPIPVPATNGFHIVVEQFAFDGCLESSRDLVHWTKLAFLPGSAMWEGEYYDTNDLSAPARFYRVRQGE